MSMQSTNPFGDPFDYEHYLSWLNEMDDREKVILYQHEILNIEITDVIDYHEHIEIYGIDMVHSHLIDMFHKVDRIMRIVNGQDEGIMNNLSTYNEILAINKLSSIRKLKINFDYDSESDSSSSVSDYK